MAILVTRKSIKQAESTAGLFHEQSKPLEAKDNLK